MGSFLATSKMDPALALRIEASVSGRRRAPGRTRVAPRIVALTRAASVIVAVVVVALLVVLRRHEEEDLRTTRAELIATIDKSSQSLGPEGATFLPRAESWLVKFSRAYDGEVVADELRAPGAFAAMLSRPLVYVRGPIGSFATGRGISEAAASSTKDGLLLCLLAPPPSRVEKAMLPAIREAYRGGPSLELASPNVRRLHEVELGLPFLAPTFRERVRTTSSYEVVSKMRRDYDRANVPRAVDAARSSLLLVVLDEPGDRDEPAELDGERTHWVRIGLVDLGTERLLLGSRQHVDPGWISLAKKSEYAHGLDGCALSFDLHERVRASVKP